MTEFQELVKDAPKFVSMERGELVAYAYGMYAAVAKTDAENAKLRELVDALMGCGTRYHTMSGACPMFDSNAKDCCKAEEIARELGVKAE